MATIVGVYIVPLNATGLGIARLMGSSASL